MTPQLRSALLAASFSILLPVASCDDVQDSLEMGPPDWRGTYDVEGTWNLSGPFAEDQGLGWALSEIILGEVVSAVGVPSLLQESAQEKLSELVGGPLATVIEGHLPPEAGPDSPLVSALRASLATVQVSSGLQLEDGLLPGSVEMEFEREKEWLFFKIRPVTEIEESPSIVSKPVVVLVNVVVVVAVVCVAVLEAVSVGVTVETLTV